jgi:hypothetical protein
LVVAEANKAEALRKAAALTKFTLFPKLPLELRRYIWKAACFFPRMIELEKEGEKRTRTGPVGYVPVIHRGVRIASKSRHPIPGPILACKESHREAKTVYKLTRFEGPKPGETGVPSTNPVFQENLEREIRRGMVWFNPLSDILCFGKKACLGTMVYLLQTGIKFSRVAIDVGFEWADGGETRASRLDTERCDCCDGKFKDFESLQPFLEPEVNHLILQLRVLHGLPGQKNFPGCGALNDVFLFMKQPGPFDHEIRYWDGCDGFKAYTYEKPCFPLMGSSKLSMDVYVEHLLASTMTPFTEQAWKGRNQPTFHIARRTKPIPQDRVFEIVAVHLPGSGQYRMIRWLARGLHLKGCMCTYYPPNYCGPGDYFFKLMGSELAVAVGKELLAKEIARGENLFKQKFAIVDPRKAVFPTFKTLRAIRDLQEVTGFQWPAIGDDY